MNYYKINELNVILQDFEWFFIKNENKIIDSLHNFDLLSDKKLKNSDTKKILFKVLVENIISEIFSCKEKSFFIIKPEIINNNCEITNYLDKDKLRKQIFILLKFLVKNKINNFIFLNKSYSNVNKIFDINNPEIKDKLDFFILNSNKLLLPQKEISDKILFKLFKQNSLKSYNL